MTEPIPGKKTYLLALLGAVSTLAIYLSQVVSDGFSVEGFLRFVNSETIYGAFATLRLAFAKK